MVSAVSSTYIKGSLKHLTINLQVDHFSFRKQLSAPFFSSPVKNKDVGIPESQGQWTLKVNPSTPPEPRSDASGNPDSLVDEPAPARPGPGLLYAGIVYQNAMCWEQFPVKFTVSLLDPEGKQLVTGEAFHVFTDKDVEWGWYDFISHKDLFSSEKRLLTNDTLRLRATIEFLHSSHFTAIYLNCVPPEASANNVVASYTELHKSRAASDFLLISVEGKIFHVHRTVLLARSPVFRGYLDQDAGSRCKATEMGAHALDIFVEFLYTGSLTRISQQTDKLLEAATRYEVGDLKTACEAELSRQITSKNAARLMVLAEKNQAAALKMAVVQFVAANWTDFALHGGLTEMKNFKWDLVEEVVQSFKQELIGAVK